MSIYSWKRLNLGLSMIHLKPEKIDFLRLLPDESGTMMLFTAYERRFIREERDMHQTKAN